MWCISHHFLQDRSKTGSPPPLPPLPPPPAPRFVRSFVHPARGVTHHPSPPLSSSLLLEHGLLSRGYPRITGQPRNGFPSSPPLNGENRGKDASCVCARARVYVCVCWWRRSSLATIDEVKVGSRNRRILSGMFFGDRSIERSFRCFELNSRDDILYINNLESLSVIS